MVPATPAIYYRITVMCGESACALPIRARMFGGGGFPTPVPPSFTSIRLRIDPAPSIMPVVTWRSQDTGIVDARSTSPFEQVLTLPGDTAATPAPDDLATLLIPGGTAPNRIGDTQGSTIVEADIGAPVNERVRIPVYAADSSWQPEATPETTHVALLPLAPPSTPPPIMAAIAYADPVASTYGTSKTLFTEVPWPKGTGGFFQAFGSVRVTFSPLPYSTPSIRWSIEGASATLSNGVLRGVHPGTATVRAQVGAPVNEIVTASLVTYPTLVLPCGHGVRFTEPNGLDFTTDPASSDLFLDCHTLQIPGGGDLLTNGDDPTRNPAPGSVRGPQFADLTAAWWRDDFTMMDGGRYDTAIEPCTAPTSTGIGKVEWGCTMMPARTLLLRTRDGHYAKWLIQIGNGFKVLAGPYQVL